MAGTKAPTKKGTTVVANIAENDELDDLIGPEGDAGHTLGLIPNADADGVAAAKAAKEEEKAAKAAEKQAAKEAKEKERAEKKAAKEAEKAAKGPRVLKGQPVTFTTKGTGETITGYGVLYYVVRFNGKLYYKEASQVTLLDELPKDDLTA